MGSIPLKGVNRGVGSSGKMAHGWGLGYGFWTGKDEKDQETPGLTTAVAARPCVWNPRPVRAPRADGREDVLVQQASGTATRPKTGYGRRVCVYRLCTGAVCVAPASAKSTKRGVRATAVLRQSTSLFC